MVAKPLNENTKMPREEPVTSPSQEHCLRPLLLPTSLLLDTQEPFDMKLG